MIRPSEEHEHIDRFPQAPSLAIVFLFAIALCALWLTTLSGEALLMSSIFAMVLTAIATWAMLAAKVQNQRAGKIEGERDLIFALSLDILCVMDIDSRFERTNPAFLNTLGHKPDELVGKSLRELVHPDDRELAEQGLHLLSTGLPANFEVRCLCGDGNSHRWLHWSANPRIAEGRIYAVAHDVTNRKHSEDALRAEFAFRKAMEDSVLTGLRAVDLNDRVIYVNRAFAEMVGQGMQALIGATPPFSYWDDQTLPTHIALDAQHQHTGGDVRVRRADGSTLDVRVHVSPLVDALGVQTGWMMAMTDITESRRARAQLEAAQERFIAVLDGLDACVGVLDATSGELLYANRALTDQADSAGEALGLAALGLPEPAPEDYLVAPAQLTKNDLPCELFDGELQHTTSNRWYHLRERALRWVDGRIVRLAVATDVTALKRAEELAREQEARLQRTSRLITMGEMATTLAHELNQPLSAISNYSMGCVNRLKQGNAKPQDLLGAMEKAATQAARAGDIVRRIREFVHKSEPRRSLISIAEVVEEALGIAGIEAKRLGARVITSIPAELPLIMADRIMIEQVLMNLVKNAAEAMQQVPLGSRQITVEAMLNTPYIEVSVTDSGCGISREQLENLFSPFFTTKADGLGMGLNICRSIIESHNGRLWVDPNPAGGSIFRFSLPQEKTIEYAAAQP